MPKRICFLETIKVKNGKMEALAYHQKRVEDVFAAYDCSYGNKLVDMFQAVPSYGLYRCRVVYDLNGLFEYSYIPYEKQNIQRLKVHHCDTIEYDKKYCNRDTLEQLFMQRGLCDDVLIVKNGYITDTTIANIALYDGKKWVTPETPLLAGTKRAALIEAAYITPKKIHYNDLKNYQGIALMNAMIDFDIITKEKLGDVLC